MFDFNKTKLNRERLEVNLILATHTFKQNLLSSYSKHVRDFIFKCAVKLNANE